MSLTPSLVLLLRSPDASSIFNCPDERVRSLLADSSAVASYLVGLPGVKDVRGDINDPASLRDLLVGCDAVIAAHGARRSALL